MSIIKCITQMVEAKQLNPDQGDELMNLARKIRKDNEKIHPPEIADVKTQQRIAEILKEGIERKQLLATRKVNAMQLIDTQMKQHPKGLEAGAISHLARDLEANNAAPWANVESTQRSYLGLFHAMFADGIDALRPRVAGLVRDKTIQRNVLKELFGEESGDAVAKRTAQSWGDTAEFAREQFNAHGGNMAKREKWGLPQSHDRVKVGEVSQDEWINYVLPRLDRKKMINRDSGLPLSDDRLMSLLGKTYDRIRTNGLIDLDPVKGGGRTLAANRHQDHRFLIFKDSESWLDYETKFGSGDIYGTMTNHLEVMSKDISILKVLGPDPDAMVRFMIDTVKKSAAETGKEIPNIRLRNIQNTYDVLTDRINDGADEPVARAMAGTRNLLTAIQLGGAVLSAVTDFAFSRLTSKFNGIDASRVLKNYMGQMSPTSGADRKLAVQMGLVAESWTSVALAQKRYFGEVMGPKLTQQFSDTVLRASLLTPHTQAMRHAFGLEALGYLARNSKKGFGELDEPMRNSLSRYGITENDWNIIRNSEFENMKGAEFVDVRKLTRDGNIEQAQKLQQFILTEMDFATPVPGARERALVTGGTRPNTLAGQLMRSVAMYKTFPVTIITGHLMRGLTLSTQGKDQAGKYLASFFISATIMGAMAVQMKNMAKGKDPIPMNVNSEEGKKFWQAALLQGGGVGIFGDFVFADHNRFGSGPAMTFAGPVAKLVDDTFDLTVGNLQEAIKGEDTQMGKELANAVRRYTPGGSIWYSRLAFERLVADQLQLMADDKARSSFKRKQTNARKDFGQKYWWSPGKTAPSRSPDLENALK